MCRGAQPPYCLSLRSLDIQDLEKGQVYNAQRTRKLIRTPSISDRSFFPSSSILFLPFLPLLLYKKHTRTHSLSFSFPHFYLRACRTGTASLAPIPSTLFMAVRMRASDGSRLLWRKVGGRVGGWMIEWEEEITEYTFGWMEWVGGEMYLAPRVGRRARASL